MSDFAALVLAAGASTRFEGGHKLLAEFEGRALILHVLELAKLAPVEVRLVITGARVGEIAALAEKAGMRTLHNPDFASGLSSSLKAGLAALPLDCAGALVLLGDMPLIRPSTLDTILAAARANPAYAAIVPTHRGEWGQPVLLRRSLFGEIARLSGDQGARAMLRSRADIMTLEINDPGILADVDTRDALEAVKNARPAGPVGRDDA
jgi:molybdenum cofactor cytidylyltransferase